MLLLWPLLLDLSLLCLLVDVAGQFLHVAVECLDFVLAGVSLLLEECALVEVAQGAKESPAEHLLMVVLVLVFDAVVGVLVRQDRVHVVIEFLKGALLHVGRFLRAMSCLLLVLHSHGEEEPLGAHESVHSLPLVRRNEQLLPLYSLLLCLLIPFVYECGLDLVRLVDWLVKVGEVELAVAQPISWPGQLRIDEVL